MDEDLKLDIREIDRQFKGALDRVERYKDSLLNSDGSPRVIHQNMANAFAVTLLLELSSSIIGLIESDMRGAIKWERERAVDYIKQASHRLAMLNAEDYCVMFDAKDGPYESCQILNGTSHSSSIRHRGTRRTDVLGFGSSTDGGCGGPLRTKQEIDLGMCGSCLRRHGPRFGLPVLTPMAISFIASKWSNDSSEGMIADIRRLGLFTAKQEWELDRIDKPGEPTYNPRDQKPSQTEPG